MRALYLCAALQTQLVSKQVAVHALLISSQGQQQQPFKREHDGHWWRARKGAQASAEGSASRQEVSQS